MKYRFQITFFQKLLITYLIAVLIPVIIMGRQMVSGYQRTFEHEIMQMNVNMLGEISSVIDLKMREMEAIAVNMDLNPTLRPYRVSSSPYGAILAIQTLAQYRSTNSFIYEIAYYIRGKDYIYTSTTAYEKHSFFKHFFTQTGYDSSEFIDLLENCRTPIILPSRQTEFVNKQVRLMTCIYPLPIQSEQYATAIFFVDESQIDNLVKSIFQNTDGSIIIYDVKGDPLLTLPSIPAPDFMQIISAICPEERQINQPISTVINLDGERIAVSYISSGYRSLSYVSLTPLQRIMAPAQRLYNRFIFTLVIVFVSGCIIILGSMFVVYKPLHNLLHKAQSKLGLMADTRNEIQLIDEILEKMQRDNRTMQLALQKSQHSARLAFLMDLFNGMITDIDTLKQRSSLIDVDIIGKAVSVILLLPEDPSVEISDSLLYEAEEHMKPICGFYPLIMIGENAVPVLLTLAKHGYEEILDMCIKEAHNFFHERRILVTIGVGMVFNDELQVPNSFHQAMDALNYRFIWGKGQIIYFENIVDNNDQILWYPREELDMLIRSIKAGDIEGIRQAVSSVFTQIQKKNIGIFAARCLCYDLVNTVAKIAINYNISADLLERQLKDMLRLPQTETVQQLSEYLIDICNKLSEQLASLENTGVERILDYIDKNYRSYDFSVYNMADELGISYSYMNRLFQSHINQSVLEYVTDKRMEFIKEKLETTDLPIKDIIRSAGYNDIPNFNRKFKQREGISPSRYRKIAQEALRNLG